MGWAALAFILQKLVLYLEWGPPKLHPLKHVDVNGVLLNIRLVPFALCITFGDVLSYSALETALDFNMPCFSQGAYMVVKIIIEMVRMKLDGSDEGIGSLIKDLEDPVESVELRMNILTEPNEAKKKGAEAVQTLRMYIEQGRIGGWELDSCGDCWVSEGCLVDSNDEPAAIDAQMYRVRVSDEKQGPHGWIHVRQSVHNPNIAVNMQSSIVGGCQSMSQILRDRFLLASELDKVLDITEIDDFARKGVR